MFNFLVAAIVASVLAIPEINGDGAFPSADHAGPKAPCTGCALNETNTITGAPLLTITTDWLLSQSGLCEGSTPTCVPVNGCTLRARVKIKNLTGGTTYTITRISTGGYTQVGPASSATIGFSEQMTCGSSVLHNVDNGVTTIGQWGYTCSACPQ